MEVKTIYSDWENIDQKLRDKKVHIIAFAEEGKSVFKAFGEFIGKISQEVLSNYCYQANRMYGFISLFPLMNLSAIAKKYFRQEMSEPEKVQFEKIIRTAEIKNEGLRNEIYDSFSTKTCAWPFFKNDFNAEMEKLQLEIKDMETNYPKL